MMMIISGIILVVTLVVFALGKSPVFRIDRAGAAIIGAALTVATGLLTFDQAAQSIDFRTIGLLFAMMIVTANLKESGFFRVVGNYMATKLTTGPGLLFGVTMVSGLLSAFFINDIVCLLFTPIVLMICKRKGVTSVPYLIGVATASNIGSAGTLLGNPQNILIGSISKLPFFTYLGIAGPVAFIGLVVNYFVIRWVYKSEVKAELAQGESIKLRYHPYLMWKSLTVTLLILAGFLFGREPVVIASLGAAYLLVTRRVKPPRIYADIDFNLLVIFGGLFVIMAGVEKSGLMAEIMQAFAVKTLPVFALLTVALSNVFSNVPAVMLLKSYIPAAGGDIWWAGLAVFSTLAGNLTLTGSIANLIVVETAKSEGVKISFLEYLRVGLPLTLGLTALGISYFILIL